MLLFLDIHSVHILLYNTSMYETNIRMYIQNFYVRTVFSSACLKQMNKGYFQLSVRNFIFCP